MYKSLVDNKISFLDDILNYLSLEIDLKDEDTISLNSCYSEEKDEILGDTYVIKPFLPKNKERLYLRVALLHLEKEGYIEKHINNENINIPLYIITYSGVILVENGGYSKKLLLDKLKEFLQRFAWFVTIIGLLLNAYIHRDKLITSFCNCDTSTTQKIDLKEDYQRNKQILK